MTQSCRGSVARGLAYVVCAAAFVALVACRSAVTDAPVARGRRAAAPLISLSSRSTRCRGPAALLCNAHIETPTLDGLAAKRRR